MTIDELRHRLECLPADAEVVVICPVAIYPASEQIEKVEYDEDTHQVQIWATD